MVVAFAPMFVKMSCHIRYVMVVKQHKRFKRPKQMQMIAECKRLHGTVQKFSMWSGRVYAVETASEPGSCVVARESIQV